LNQLREIQAGKRAHLDTWNQLTYDLADMTRDDRVRIQLTASSEPTFTRSARLRLWIRN